MSLRDKVIDGMVGEHIHPAVKELAGRYLDRALVVLADNADEWAGSTALVDWADWTESTVVLNLLTVLEAPE